MSVPRPPARKPTIEDRIALWLTAYRAVLDEIATHDTIPQPSDPDGARLYLAVVAPTRDERLTAANVAAELVKGVADAHDSGSR